MGYNWTTMLYDEKNVIIICIDGGTLNEAQNSSIMKQFSSNSMFFT